MSDNELIYRIKTALKQEGISQRELALKLGKKETEISRWLSGRMGISAQNLQRIEEVLGRPLSRESLQKSGNRSIRIGIVGTGSIAERFVQEACFVKGIKVSAVYNPIINEAVRFCERYSIAKYHTSPEDFVSEVDAVYIASPVSSHYYYSKLLLESGCHVLCEVPFTYSMKEASELIHIAASKNLVLMLALKTAYCPSFQQLMLIAQKGLIGQIVDVSATVTNLLPEDVTVDYSNERIVENTTYPLLAFFKLLGSNYSKCRPFLKTEGDRILYTNACLEYSDAIGSMKVGVGVKSEGSLVVSGTKGYIYVPAPWWKPDYFEVRFENPSDNKKYFFPYEASGLRYELQAFKDKICGIDHTNYVSRTEMLKMIEVQNKIFKEL